MLARTIDIVIHPLRGYPTGGLVARGPSPSACRYIAVEGVIGVGKTTLVDRLSMALAGRTVLEEFEENPFLPDFYRDRRAFALSTQIFFLMSRFRQQDVLSQGDLFRMHTISDYMFDKDRIFALLTLENHELALYERLFEVLRPQVPMPDLVIFLRADHDTIMERIQARGRSYELDMDPEYIRELATAYVDFFSSFRACPVLTVDTTRIDFRTDKRAVEALARSVVDGQVPDRLEAEIPTPARAPLMLPGFA